MDFLAHGLWSGAIFGRRSKVSWRWAFFWGTAPDLFAFGPAIVAGIITGDNSAWARYVHEGVIHSRITWYSNHAYNVTHSLVVWSVIAVVFWLFQRKVPWVFAPSALHILCDIPLHRIEYFPTPFLWPFNTPLHDGIHWANPGFMLVNYALIVLTYRVIAYRRNR